MTDQNISRILPWDCNNEILHAWRKGDFEPSLKLQDRIIDQHWVFKRAQFCVMAGLANVGKTTFVMWYFFELSKMHGLKWDIYSSENEIEDLKRILLQFYYHESFDRIYDIENGLKWIGKHFRFVDTTRMYTIEELLEVFKSTDSDGCVIDPHNSLLKAGRVNTHEYDYETAGKIRLFTRETRKSLYLLAHCFTEAARKMYPKGHDLEGYNLPPTAADIEGGGKWVNRCDDFAIIHRFTNHPEKWRNTYIHVKKVKVQQTGGKPTMMDFPAVVEFDHHNFTFNKN